MIKYILLFKNKIMNADQLRALGVQGNTHINGNTPESTRIRYTNCIQSIFTREHGTLEQLARRGQTSTDNISLAECSKFAPNDVLNDALNVCKMIGDDMEKKTGIKPVIISSNDDNDYPKIYGRRPVSVIFFCRYHSHTIHRNKYFIYF